MANYVFHFTGKNHQSYVMKDEQGTVVYEAVCEKITLFRDTPYIFRDCATGKESNKMVGHTMTHTLKINGFGGAVKSSFKIDKVESWNILYDMGYDFHFHMRGAHTCFDMTLNGVPKGTIETAGTGVMDPKYAKSPAGKIPTNGIFTVSCEKEDIPGFFLMCFTLARTEFAMNLMK